jgi:hypothetical protein
MTPSMTPLVSTGAGALAPTLCDAALTRLWFHDKMIKAVAVRHVQVSPASLKEKIVEPVLIMKTASCLLALAALEGLAMVGIRFIGNPRRRPRRMLHHGVFVRLR